VKQRGEERRRKGDEERRRGPQTRVCESGGPRLVVTICLPPLSLVPLPPSYQQHKPNQTKRNQMRALLWTSNLEQEDKSLCLARLYTAHERCVGLVD